MPNHTGSKSGGTKSGFGYLWWGVFREDYGLRKGIFAASGIGTQKIYIVPEIKTVIVFLKDTKSYTFGDPAKVSIGTEKQDQFLSKILSSNEFYVKQKKNL